MPGSHWFTFGFSPGEIVPVISLSGITPEVSGCLFWIQDLVLLTLSSYQTTERVCVWGCRGVGWSLVYNDPSGFSYSFYFKLSSKMPGSYWEISAVSCFWLTRVHARRKVNYLPFSSVCQLDMFQPVGRPFALIG